MDTKGKRIILGSSSPRRRELLAGMDIEFTVDTENFFEEVFPPETPHEDVPRLMAEGKSAGFHRSLDDDEILITSDTMVICDNLILGKPHGREDAFRMLRSLSGKEHHVTTAVTIRDNKKKVTFSDTTYVHFKELTDDEIYYYIDKYHPFDKAGAYAIQEWIGYIGISSIDGSIYTVIGLPVHKVYEHLSEFLK